MIACPLTADVLAAQFNHFWQIQVIPLNLAIVHALKARIEAAADVDNGRFRVAGQEIRT